ncbi:ABC transporter G family member 10 [Punica granatum]|uniref:ABC transporter domain-containing protein n=2 Tax=Punica granatum TaxID=22663 RepID=A0A218XAE7_PUNGR|nr:ABC transporter G family member 10 [Punica granatum]OWM81461.1 hypothetical protein CDL15_Pgr007499 [Punica granatum]PKI49604.1 hypothetical protein CRG98_029994 [Punica granatum]
MELPLKSPDSGGSDISLAWRMPYKLETKNLSYKLCTKLEEYNWACFETRKRAPKFILKDVNCEARPGEITAIAGPSGAGKTTLLEVLAANKESNGGKVLGQVLVNGQPIDSRWIQRLSGYVSQEDALFGSLTVEETLMYSALFRLRVGRREAADRVRELIKELGLDHVSSSRVGGTGWDRGISGGEKRRVSIGVELVHDPPVILIDEPTSGLDSASALHLVRLLKFMALHQGKTIVLTIHQPGFRILELIDRVVLLSDGLVLHNGSLALLEEKLMFAGLRVPNHANVLEYAIDAIESMDPQDHEEAQNFLRGNGEGGGKVNAHCGVIIPDEKTHSYLNCWLEEVLILGRRFCSNIFRTKQLFATRVIQALAAGFMLGTIFLDAGDDVGPLALQTRLGFFAFSLTFLLSSTTEGLPIFLQERRILMRETSRGAYRVSSYVISNTLVFVPFLLMVGSLYSVPVYWLVGLRSSTEGFLYFLLVVWMVLLMSNSFVACFSALVPNFITGTSVIAGLMGSFFLFSGYFIAKDNIPIYWTWMHYLSLFKYPFECFLVNEYGGLQGRSRCLEFGDGQCTLTGSGFLRQQELEESAKWNNLGVMFGFIIGYRVLCFLILWFRCYQTRN